MSDARATITEPDTPHPRRYRWLMRLSIIYALVIALLVMSWFAWDAYSLRIYHGEISRLQSLGQRVTAADINGRPTVPATQNAAIYYRQAFGLMGSSLPGNVIGDVDWRVTISPAALTAAQADAASVAPVLALARRAVACSQANWGAVAKSPLINIMLPSLNDARQLCNILIGLARLRHVEGDDAAALDSLNDAMHLGQMQDQDMMCLVQHLVAIGICSASTHAIRDIAGEVKIGGTRGATPQQLATLIARLLNTAATDQSFLLSLQGEQAFELDSTSSPSTYRGLSSLPEALLPSVRLSAVRCTRSLSTMLAAFKPDDDAANLATFGRSPRGKQGTALRLLNDLFQQTFAPTFGRLIEAEAVCKTDRRAAAVLLALRWFEVDHSGALPVSLEDLVPHYLPGVPPDGYAGGLPMRYVRSMTIDGIITPVVYSVGDNGQDDHASTQPADNRVLPDFVYQRNDRRLDRVYPLRHPPPAEPTTEPTE